MKTVGSGQWAVGSASGLRLAFAGCGRRLDPANANDRQEARARSGTRESSDAPGILTNSATTTRFGNLTIAKRKLLLVLLWATATSAAWADNPKMELDFSSDVRLLDSRFGR